MELSQSAQTSLLISVACILAQHQFALIQSDFTSCVAFLQKYQDDLADLPDNKGGLQSTLYSLLTISLVASGAAYLLQPQVHCLHSMLCAEYV